MGRYFKMGNASCCVLSDTSIFSLKHVSQLFIMPDRHGTRLTKNIKGTYFFHFASEWDKYQYGTQSSSYTKNCRYGAYELYCMIFQSGSAPYTMPSILCNPSLVYRQCNYLSRSLYLVTMFRAFFFFAWLPHWLGVLLSTCRPMD